MNDPWEMAGDVSDGVYDDCAACGHRVFNPKPCMSCEHQRINGRDLHPADYFCSDCAKPCTSCGEITCESHARSSGECLSCSGPTDAEMHAAGLLG